MRLHVTGAAGVLGRIVVEEAIKADLEVIGYTHEEWDIADLDDGWERIAEGHDSVLINCAGIPVSHGQVITTLRAADIVRSNALGPRILAAGLTIPIVHVSTDCVFSGRSDEQLDEDTEPDPIDVYGRSKVIGEVDAPHVLNVRGSFVSWDGGLLKWLRGQKGPINGWMKTTYSGLYVRAYARVLIALAGKALVGMNGIVHVPRRTPGVSVSKGDLVLFIANALSLPVQVWPVDEPVIYRALDSFLWPQLSIPIPTWDEMLQEVIDDFNRYSDGHPGDGAPSSRLRRRSP